VRGLLEPYRSMGGDGLNLDNLSTIRAIAIQTDLDLSDGPIDGVEIEDVVIDEVPVRLYRPPAEDELPLHVYSSDTMVLRPNGGA
jgi:acetyl esterase